MAIQPRLQYLSVSRSNIFGFSRGGNGWWVGTIVAGAYTPDLSLGDVHDLTLVHATTTTINAPINSTGTRQAMWFVLRQDSTGGGKVTFNVVYIDPTSGASVTTVVRDIDSRANAITRLMFIQDPSGKFLLFEKTTGL